MACALGPGDGFAMTVDDQALLNDRVFTRFAAELGAYVADGRSPASEATVVHCMARALRDALELSAGEIEFEEPTADGRIDLVLRPCRLALEAKYLRPPVRNKGDRAWTMDLGELLADVNRLAGLAHGVRAMLIVMDETAFAYLKAQPVPIPWSVGARRTISPAQLVALALTTTSLATKRRPWGGASLDVVWRQEWPGWTSLVWQVQPSVQAVG